MTLSRALQPTFRTSRSEYLRISGPPVGSAVVGRFRYTQQPENRELRRSQCDRQHDHRFRPSLQAVTLNVPKDLDQPRHRRVAAGATLGIEPETVDLRLDHHGVSASGGW